MTLSKTIDGPEFQDLMGNLIEGYEKVVKEGFSKPYDDARAKLLNYIDDAMAAPQVVADEADLECQIPPHGWRCTRGSGHDGSCAAVECPEDVAAVKRGMARLASAPVQAQEPVAAKPVGRVWKCREDHFLYAKLDDGIAVSGAVKLGDILYTAAPVQPVAVPDEATVDQLIELAGALEVEFVRLTIADMRTLRFKEGPFQAGYETAIDEIESRMGLEKTNQATPAAQGDAKDAHCYECDGGLVYADGDIEPCRSCEQGKLLALEAMAKEIYETWQSQPEFVAWQHGGNSRMQDRARDMARAAIAAKAAS